MDPSEPKGYLGQIKIQFETNPIFRWQNLKIYRLANASNTLLLAGGE